MRHWIRKAFVSAECATKPAIRRLFPGVKWVSMVASIGFTLMDPFCATTVQTNISSSWTQAELTHRAWANILLENMASRIQANRADAAEYVTTNIGGGPPQSCDEALSLAALDVCEWANLLRSATEAYGEETTTEGPVSARGCISNPKPFLYIISIRWEIATLATPANANCDLRDVGGGNLRRALLTVVRVSQDS